MIRVVIGSVHLADVGPRRAASLVLRAPSPKKVTGLRWATVALGAPLSSSVLPKPGFHRAGMLAFWDDDAALDAFEANDPRAQALASGWSARLRPLRAHGSWPGLDPDLSKKRHIDTDGVAVVFTLGKLRISQGVRFLRASAKAEEAVLRAPGLIWATGLGRPPYLATCSIWESQAAISAYAFDDKAAAHPQAISQGREKPFHHQEAFIRFEPYRVTGHLDGKNPLPAEAVTS
jgi:heme-degrading monooxygenase HmoA